MTDIWDGEPRVFIDPGGATMEFKGGQPVMDRGLENAVSISLHTQRGWWGNDLFGGPDTRVGADFEARAQRPITATNIEDSRKAASAALQWLISKGLASEVTVEVTNPSGFRLDFVHTIRRPEGPDVELQTIKNGVDWIEQRDDPAHRRR
jgi:phage gp46-like protein